MSDIKTKDMKPKTVKTLDKAVAWTERVKDPIVYANEKAKDATDGQVDVLDYGEDKIKYVSNRAKDEAIYASKKAGTYTKDKVVKYAKTKYQKKKLIKGKSKDIKGTVEKTKKGIKTTKNTIKNTEKVAKETAKASKRALEQGRKLAIKSAKATAKGIKIAIKASISAIKDIIAGVKSLIGMLAAGGSVAAIAIVIICLVGLLVTSIFGIFFSSEKTSKNGITMKEVVSECNQEFGNKLETIQTQNPHDEYVLEGNMASWKDVLLVYTVKQSNGINQQEVITVEKTKKGIKTTKNTIKNTEKVAKETAKASKRALEQGRKLAIKSAKATAKGIKIAIKASISAIKDIIAGVKSLIGMLAAGGSVAAIAIVIICLVGLLVTSIFGIFFSSEKTSKNGITMKEVVSECNQEFGNKLETIQTQNPHDEYILEGNMASWKDVLLIYTVKQSNGINQQEVITVDNTKKALIKQIFWDMNEITSEVKTEMVKSSSVNTTDIEPDSQKKVLHIYIKSKTADDMKTKYNFNPAQLKQYNELSNKKYASLWNNAIFGSVDSGEYVNWRQYDSKWSNIKVGKSSGTLGSIGCLITSISILIEKSGCNTMIKPFNPGTFLEALNKNNGFDGNGNLQYAAVTKAVPAFKYVGNQNLRGKSKEEKLSIIKQYLDSGYYLTAEVKGATKGSQHWVAVTKVDGNSVIMVDPGSNQTIMWNAYNYEKTSQFNYFKVE